MNNNIIVLAGLSAAGKDTLAKIISLSCGYNFVVSHSTRPMRPEESQGNPYYFIDDNEMLSMLVNKELVEIREYKATKGNWYYALHKNQIEDDKKYIIVLDLLGAEEIKKHYKDRVKTIFIQSSDEDRLVRAQTRKDFCMDEWNRRLKDDKEKFNESYIKKVCDVAIINNDLKKATINIIKYIEDLESRPKYQNDVISKEEFERLLKQDIDESRYRLEKKNFQIEDKINE